MASSNDETYGYHINSKGNMISKTFYKGHLQQSKQSEFEIFSLRPQSLQNLLFQVVIDLIVVAERICKK